MEALNLPDTLTATGYTVAEDTEVLDSGTPSDAVTTPAAISIEGVTWELDPENEINNGNSTYDPTQGNYAFTPVLPSGYTLAEGVALPEIKVTISVANRMLLATAEVSYIDGQGTEQTETATPITVETGEFTSGWYYVPSAANISRGTITVNGTVNLILEDGGSLTATGGWYQAGINVSGTNSLTIYGQQNGTGKLNATGGDRAAGIGGGQYASGGTITINGGTVTAKGDSSGAGIGGGNGGNGGTITINGGMVTANGGNYGAGIGGGGSSSSSSSTGGTITITGGTVNATGYAGIGGGDGGAAGTFSTGENGNAFIVATSISDKNNQSAWSGIIFDGNNGKVYGTPTLKTSGEIPAGKTLTIEDGKTLPIANGAALSNSGTINIQSGGTINNAATMTNNGFITIRNGGTLSNAGTISNKGFIYQFPGGQFTGTEVQDNQIITEWESIEVGGFNVIGGSFGEDYSLIDDALTISSDAPLTIKNTDSSTPNSNRIKVVEGVNANITLNGVNVAINGNALDLNTGGICTITLEKGSFNTLKSNNEGSGILAPERPEGSDAKLIIQGDGELNALGPDWFPGICGNGGRVIEIRGGVIYSAGVSSHIGNSSGAGAATVIITGGSVKTGNTDIPAIVNAPVNSDNAPVYLGKLADQSAVTDVSIDGTPYYIAQNHTSDDTLYLYMTGESQSIQVKKGGTVYTYNATYVSGGVDGDAAKGYFTFVADGTATPSRETSVAFEESGYTAPYATPAVEVKLTISEAITKNTGLRSVAMNEMAFTLKDSADTTIWTGSGAVPNNATIYTFNVPTARLKLGAYTLTAKYGGSATDKPASNTATTTLTIEQATPTLVISPAAISYGETLSQSNLSTSTAKNAAGDTVAGTFLWQSDAGTVKPIVADSGSTNYSVIFTPMDTTNYATVTKSDVTLTVNKRILTPSISVDGVIKPYDENTNIVGTQPTLSLSGGLSGETPVATATYAYADATVGENKTIVATVSLTNAPVNANYELTTTEVRKSGAAITTGTQTVSTAIGYGKIAFTYGDVAQALVTTPVFSQTGTIAYTSSNSNVISVDGTTGVLTFHKASSTPVIITATNTVANYEDITSALGITVAQKNASAATISVNGTYTYTGSPLVPESSNVTVELGGVTIPATQYTFATSDNTNAGSATLTFTFKDNYTGTASGNFTIGKADALSLAGSAVMIKNQPNYEVKLDLTTVSGYPEAPGGAPNFTVTSNSYNGLTSTTVDERTLTLTADNTANSIEDTVTVKVSSMNNYEDSAITITVSYTDKTLVTITGVEESNGLVYNGMAQTGYTGTPSSTFNGTYNISYEGTGETNYTASATPPTNAGSYKVTISVPEDNVTYIGSKVLNFTIAKKEVTVKPEDKSVKQGDYMPSFNLIYHGLIGSETLTPSDTPAFTCDATNTDTVGNYTITWSNMDDVSFTGEVTKNYEIKKQETATLIISQNIFTVSIADAGENATGFGQYASGQTVNISAGTKNGYTFNGWSGDVTFANEKMAKTTFTMPEKDVNITANWLNNSGSTGGGGGGGSNNDSGDKNDNNVTITTDPTKPNSPTKGEVIIDKPDKNGNVKIPDKQVNSALDKATEEAQKTGTIENGIAITIKLTDGTTNVSLDRKTLDRLIASNVKNFTLDFTNINMNFDLLSLKEIMDKTTNAISFGAIKATDLKEEARKIIGARPVYQLSVSHKVGIKETNLTNFGKGNVSIELDYIPTLEEEKGSLQAVYIDDNDKVKWLDNSSYDKAKKAITFSTNHFSMFGIGYKEVSIFTDILDHWAKEDIMFIFNSGMMRGANNTSFAPDNAVTRGVFVEALGELAKIDTSIYQGQSFSDVSSDSYYYAYIEWANEKEIVTGIGEGKFAPEKNITREQMAVILNNFTKVMGYELNNTHEEMNFSDSGYISDYAKESVKNMQMTGMLMGKGENIFDPQGMATRGEVCAMLRNFMEMTLQ